MDHKGHEHAMVFLKGKRVAQPSSVDEDAMGRAQMDSRAIYTE
jgi:hypothetical protein